MTATATIETARCDNVLLVPNTAFRFRPQTAAAASSVSFMMPPPRTRVKQVKERIQQAERERTVYVLKDGAAQAVSAPLAIGACLYGATACDTERGLDSAHRSVRR